MTDSAQAESTALGDDAHDVAVSIGRTRETERSPRVQLARIHKHVLPLGGEHRT